MKTAVALCALILPVFAGESVILSSGMRLRAERHEVDGAIVRLHIATGVIEMPASAISGYETEEYVAPPKAPDPAVVVAQAPAVPEPQAPKKARTLQELLDTAADKAGLPAAIVHSVAKNESGFRQDAVSRKGAIGLMQLMPATAASLQADPNNPQENAEAGARYLRDLLIKYDGDVPKALAAYNAGPGAVDKYNGVPPYPETRSYVNRVINEYKKRTGASE